MDSSRVPIGSGQLTADPRRIHCHEPDIVQYVNFFSTLLVFVQATGHVDGWPQAPADSAYEGDGR